MPYALTSPPYLDGQNFSHIHQNRNKSETHKLQVKENHRGFKFLALFEAGGSFVGGFQRFWLKLNEFSECREF